MNSNTVNMKSVAGYLAIGLAVVVGLLWFSPWDTGSETKGGGGAPVEYDKALAAEGETLSTSNGCTGCHTIDGGAGAGPTWQGLFGATGKQGGEVDEAYIVKVVTQPPAAMATYQGKFTEEDGKAIAEYIKSLQ
jgi:cytochrome c oxidase subunit 2